MSKLGAPPAQLGIIFTGMALVANMRSLGEGLIADLLDRKRVLCIYLCSLDIHE
jgi:hypothetical protein